MQKNRANFVPLTPVSFLRRAAMIYPDKLAVVYGERKYSYREFYQRSCRLASALSKRGIKPGDTVAVMAPNIPEMLEAHNGVPMIGAVLNPLNIRLDSDTIAFILKHGEARVLITDREYSPVVERALAKMEQAPLVIDINDTQADGGKLLGDIDYEELLAEGEPDTRFDEPRDEWQSICLLYTSGTTNDPKGVQYHYRGAYLNALGNMATMALAQDSVYLWSLPMFHCNGWTFTWAVTAACATHVCLRKVDPAVIYSIIDSHRVTHMCGAPVVLNMLVHAPQAAEVVVEHSINFATGGAAPPSAVIEAMERKGFHITHLYGLTESYGPAISCEWQNDWDKLDLEARSSRMSRQGVKYLTLEEAMIADPETLEELPWDGVALGELMLRGNTLMKGYHNNPRASAAAFSGGWLHTGDLGVRHADGYIEIKDRSSDIIISGGENISSLEVEEVLYRHADVVEAAVVAMHDDKWGETPCAFVTLAQGADTSAEDLIAFCRDRLASFKLPRTIVFGALAKTATGKIQKHLLREQASQMQNADEI